MDEAREPAIRLRGLTKSYANQRVLDEVELEVEAGCVFGYIGPNGAGKSTTVRILTGMLTPFEGEASVLGLDVRRDPLGVKRRVGYVPENANLYESLTVGEHLAIAGNLQGLGERTLRRRIPALLEAFELAPRSASRLGSLSKGMRQKLLFCAALLHDPRVLFLDEPLNGLDVASTIFVKELLRALADRGRTIFYCSHVMDVVERVCDRIVVLKAGRVVADGSFEELQARSEERHLEAIFAQLTGSGDDPRRVQLVVEALES
jgi:ABC-2 type transport system ATP-binding protein